MDVTAPVVAGSTPRAVNVAATTAPASNLILNEWIPVGLSGERSWIELHNRSATAPVAASAVLTVNVPTILVQNVERLPDGSVRMRLSGAMNRSYAIDASPHLTNWATLDTVFYSNGPMPFADTTTGGVTNRFYRARLVP